MNAKQRKAAFRRALGPVTDLAAQVRAVEDLARASLFGDEGGITNPEGLLDHLQAVAGDIRPSLTDDSDGWETYCNCVRAAYAIGIATGQLLAPGVLTKRGAR
jgi:hypothetical protein